MAAGVRATVSQATLVEAAHVAMSERVLWSFGATADGLLPRAGLLSDKRGNLYGTTASGGVNGEGTVFELSPPGDQRTQWREKVLWSFGASGDGRFPEAGLIADSEGNLYGTTEFGGAYSCRNIPFFCGTAFELSPPNGQKRQWRERVLWSFGAGGDGARPQAGLTTDKSGNLYGTTTFGGANSCTHNFGCGTVFELARPHGQHVLWAERVLWSFGATNDDGECPLAGLLVDKRGNLYGTTESGGSNSVANSCGESVFCGTVFELSPPTRQHAQWKERVLWSFGASQNGAEPFAGLVADKRGNLYGTTAFGGVMFEGTAFELSPPTRQHPRWKERVLWSFGEAGSGVQPQAGLLADKRGNLYGTTGGGGATSCPGIGCGTVFELSPPHGRQAQWHERVLWSFGVMDDGRFPSAGLIADKHGNLYATTGSGGAIDKGSAFQLNLPYGNSR
jgi:uncharacterized repeat protein (TIGR03803 family)